MFVLVICNKYEIALIELSASHLLCGVPLTRHSTRLSFSEKGGLYVHQGISLMASTEEEVTS